MANMRLPQLRLRRSTRGAGSVRPRDHQLAPARRQRPLTLPWRRLLLTATLLVVTAGLAYGAQPLLLGDTLRVRDVTVIGAEVADPFEIAAAAGRSLDETAELVRELVQAGRVITLGVDMEQFRPLDLPHACHQTELSAE